MPFEIRKNSKGVNTKVYVPNIVGSSKPFGARETYITDVARTKGIIVSKQPTSVPSIPFGPKPKPGAGYYNIELPGEAKLDRAIKKGAKAVWTIPEKAAARAIKSEELRRKEREVGITPSGFLIPQKAREARLERVKAEKKFREKQIEKKIETEAMEREREKLFKEPPRTVEQRFEELRAKIETPEYEKLTSKEKQQLLGEAREAKKEMERFKRIEAKKLKEMEDPKVKEAYVKEREIKLGIIPRIGESVAEREARVKAIERNILEEKRLAEISAAKALEQRRKETTEREKAKEKDVLERALERAEKQRIKEEEKTPKFISDQAEEWINLRQNQQLLDKAINMGKEKELKRWVAEELKAGRYPDETDAYAHLSEDKGLGESIKDSRRDELLD